VFRRILRQPLEAHTRRSQCSTQRWAAARRQPCTASTSPPSSSWQTTGSVKRWGSDLLARCGGEEAPIGGPAAGAVLLAGVRQAYGRGPR
jgi:hypothetical protein